MKCDETRPHCRRCTETGRKCEGPVVRQFRFIWDISRPTTPIPQPEVPLISPQHSQAERRAFHYFMNQPAPLWAGTVDAKFWEDLVPQLAQTYDFVWNTVVCLGFLVEHVPYTSNTTTFDLSSPIKVTNRAHRQALRFYNRAIVNVRQLAERDQIDESIAALSYVLFASVEYQQRNARTGMNLMKQSSRILAKNLTSIQTRQNSPAAHAVHQVITPFVLRKAVPTATLGNGLPPQRVANHEGSNIPRAVLSRSPALSEATFRFHSLVYHCFEVIRVAEFVPNLKDKGPERILFMSEQQSSLNKLMHWKASFTATSSRIPDIETDWIRSYLLMYWAVCYISLATCLIPRQTIFDNYMEHFSDIVEHATVCLKQSTQSTNGHLLSILDPGVIPLLYFCATKCRDPTRRREALRLMRQAPRQENLWAFVAPDRVAAKVISVEEGECQLPFSKDCPERQYTTGLPPEERRFAHVTVVGRQAPGGRQRQALELNRFEFAPDGSRRLLDDYVWLDDGEEEEALARSSPCESLNLVTRNMPTCLGYTA